MDGGDLEVVLGLAGGVGAEEKTVDGVLFIGGSVEEAGVSGLKREVGRWGGVGVWGTYVCLSGNH